MLGLFYMLSAGNAEVPLSYQNLTMRDLLPLILHEDNPVA
jgi:hypothetical protein